MNRLNLWMYSQNAVLDLIFCRATTMTPTLQIKDYRGASVLSIEGECTLQIGGRLMEVNEELLKKLSENGWTGRELFKLGLLK